MDCGHPVTVRHADRVNWFVVLAGGVHGSEIESVIRVEGRNPITRGDRVVLGKLCHGEQSYPVILFVPDKRS